MQCFILFVLFGFAYKMKITNIDESKIFKVGTNHDVDVITFGNIKVLIVDNFYEYPDLVRELALTIPPSHRNMRAEYPGCTINVSYDLTSLVHPFNDYIQTYFPDHLPDNYVISCMDRATFLLNVMQSYGQQAEPPHGRMTPHQDNISGQNLASLIYLNTPEECAGGTAFYENETKKMLGHVEMKYNRMLLYEQCVRHCALIPKGSFEDDMYRINQLFFI